ncbi:MAG: hypothetical protein KGL39_00760 [Patescibacteria group bacterium]|nr:hypothetical protein [Patescibacteria group bacterium]
MKRSETRAKAIRLLFHPDRGYELLIQIVEGPTTILDRRIHVSLSANQLDAIDGWTPPDNESHSLELEGLRFGTQS